MPALKYTPAERIAQLETFVAEHGRLPRQLDPDEKSLAHWVRNAHRADVQVPADIRARLLAIIEVTPTAARALADATERRRLASLERFIATARRLPSSLGSPEEDRLYEFMRRVSAGEAQASESTRARVAQLVAEYGSTLDGRMQELLTFMYTHHRLPSARNERRLYSRLRRVLSGEIKTVDPAIRKDIETLAYRFRA